MLNPFLQSIVHTYCTDRDGIQLREVSFFKNSKWKGCIFVFFFSCFQLNETRINIFDYTYLAIYLGNLSTNPASAFFQCIQLYSWID